VFMRVLDTWFGVQLSRVSHPDGNSPLGVLGVAARPSTAEGFGPASLAGARWGTLPPQTSEAK
jgi:hypothetical protein